MPSRPAPFLKAIAAFPLALSVPGGARSALPCAGGRAAPRGLGRALVKRPGRRPAIRPEGEPAKPGEPRRGAPPKAQAGADRRRGGARSAEGRRARRALRRFVSRCRSSFPLRGPLQLPAKIYRRFFKGRTVPVLGGVEFIAPGGCDLSWISGLGGVRFIALGGCDLSWISCTIHKVFPPFGMVTKCAPGRVDLSPSEPRPLGGKGGGDLSHWCGLPACRGGGRFIARSGWRW